ncbi:hypothetical protein [Mycolicibacterium aurum]|uniref:hypothetical protein n=1 Tax=Mycolicibacterium aurum TaxID=1791 RepID=UPI00069DC798|nr:hypothetical protein [Mycolicibacterium aurum]
MPSVLTLIFFGFLIAGTAVVLLVPTSTVIRSRGVVVGLRLTGGFSADCPEVELDVIVSRPEGGQFAARETTLIPATELANFTPGSVVDMFYRPGDESLIAIRVPRLHSPGAITGHRPPRR